MTDEMRPMCVEYARHAIGMDRERVRRVDGFLVYISYRNSFAVSEPEPHWEAMVAEGYAKRTDWSDGVSYRMTPDGLQWLAREVGVNICMTY